ncbi:hypothetical protein [Candidatus Galacturonibacter soehngenii]|uniref:Uncharacterized protein n=1 Tax=Candidatus Galacturonatibacter soehngenii TaxID=2307010 RepID=A0A7V7UB98_9FIRM|nr:hypothetical protein [Candidatus Galacturonibacter soehngenii]KAB1437550.1 hypothetical protein F7O84_08050 [Candidatus Galacturonibacter soehngenii]
MEKLQLNNGDLIEIQNGATPNSVKVEVPSQEAFLEQYIKFKDDNLSKITFLSETGIEMSIYNNKTLDKAELQSVADEETVESKLIATFTLKDIDTTKQKLKELQETIDTLVLNTLGIELTSESEQKD